jgi:putative glutathione S-transferase
MFDTEFDAVGNASVSFLPRDRVAEVDATIDALYDSVNNGVYRAGFASTQQAYDEAIDALFAALDHYETVLSERRYLLGDQITEADWCLFTTLARFDLVYHYHFKCNLQRLRDYPNLWGYARDLYQVPGVRETCNFDHIKRHYFMSHPTLNPTRIVPRGPEIDFDAPHDRAQRFGPAVGGTAT